MRRLCRRVWQCAERAAPPRQRRLGGWYPVCTWGKVERRVRCTRARGDTARRTGTHSIHEEKGWEVRNLVTFESRVRTIGTQTVNRCNAVFRTDSRPVARDGSDRAVESGRPPTGGPVRSDRKEHRSSRVSRSYGPRSITGRTERNQRNICLCCLSIGHSSKKICLCSVAFLFFDSLELIHSSNQSIYIDSFL